MPVCTITGTILKATGVPDRGRAVYVRQNGTPGAISGIGIISGKDMTFYSNRNGIITIPLLQGLNVTVSMEGETGIRSRTFTVPDEEGAELQDLLYPWITGIAWGTADPLTIYVNSSGSATLIATLSDGTTADVTGAARITIGDANVLQPIDPPTGLWRGRAVGETTLTVTAVDITQISAFADYLGASWIQSGGADPELPAPLTVHVIMNG